jgi:hypothetical protein
MTLGLLAYLCGGRPWLQNVPGKPGTPGRAGTSPEGNLQQGGSGTYHRQAIRRGRPRRPLKVASPLHNPLTHSVCDAQT